MDVTNPTPTELAQYIEKANELILENETRIITELQPVEDNKYSFERDRESVKSDVATADTDSIVAKSKSRANTLYDLIHYISKYSSDFTEEMKEILQSMAISDDPQLNELYETILEENSQNLKDSFKKLAISQLYLQGHPLNDLPSSSNSINRDKNIINPSTQNERELEEINQNQMDFEPFFNPSNHRYILLAQPQSDQRLLDLIQIVIVIGRIQTVPITNLLQEYELHPYLTIYTSDNRDSCVDLIHRFRCFNINTYLIDNQISSVENNSFFSPKSQTTDYLSTQSQPIKSVNVQEPVIGDSSSIPQSSVPDQSASTIDRENINANLPRISQLASLLQTLQQHHQLTESQYQNLIQLLQETDEESLKLQNALVSCLVVYEVDNDLEEFIDTLHRIAYRSFLVLSKGTVKEALKKLTTMYHQSYFNVNEYQLLSLLLTETDDQLTNTVSEYIVSHSPGEVATVLRSIIYQNETDNIKKQTTLNEEGSKSLNENITTKAHPDLYQGNDIELVPLNRDKVPSKVEENKEKIAIKETKFDAEAVKKKPLDLTWVMNVLELTDFTTDEMIYTTNQFLSNDQRIIDIFTNYQEQQNLQVLINSIRSILYSFKKPLLSDDMSVSHELIKIIKILQIEKTISELDSQYLITLYQQQDPVLSAAYDVYIIDHDFEEIKDTLLRFIQQKYISDNKIIEQLAYKMKPDEIKKIKNLYQEKNDDLFKFFLQYYKDFNLGQLIDNLQNFFFIPRSDIILSKHRETFDQIIISLIQKKIINENEKNSLIHLFENKDSVILACFQDYELDGDKDELSDNLRVIIQHTPSSSQP